MTIYMKHPKLGNAHCADDEESAKVAAGWVKWPRSGEQKSAGHGDAEAFEDDLNDLAATKRKPGRPRKE